MKKPTEASSNYNHLELMSTSELLMSINLEDQTVALAVQKEIPAIEYFLKKALPQMREGGRLFYIGAGTSGRLGVVDASECPPTFPGDLPSQGMMRRRHLEARPIVALLQVPGS